jgi:predicted PurR-regulated permease PerM
MIELNSEEEHGIHPARERGFRLLLTAACLVVVLAGMKAAASFFVPVVLAFFLSVLSYPMMRWLRQHRVPHWIGVLVTVTVNVGVLVFVIQAGVHLLTRMQHELPYYIKGLKGLLDQGAIWLQNQGAAEAPAMLDQMWDWQGLGNNQNIVQGLTTIMGSTVGTAASVVSTTTVVMILMVFILMEAVGTRGRLAAVKVAGGPDFGQLLESASDIQKYLVIKTSISIVTGFLAGVWCWMFDLPYAVLWGIVAFLMNYIPAVGSIMAGVPPVLLALVTSGFGSAFGVMLGYLGINTALGTFLEPLLLGRRFGASPLVIVTSVIFWGWMWGPVGMFLAVPLTMMVKMMLGHSDEFRWMAVAMAKKKVKKGEVVLMADFDLDGEESELLGGGASTEFRGGRETQVK